MAPSGQLSSIDERRETLTLKNGAKTQKHKSSRKLRALFVGVLFATVGVLVVVPRPTFPEALPLPEENMPSATKRENEERQRARRAANGSLSRPVRTVGELIRRVGHASATGKLTSSMTNELRTDLVALLQAGETEHLLELRALQTELFLLAVSELETEGQAKQDLLELGGDFFKLARSSWINEKGDVSLSENDLRVLYRAHWNRVTGLSRHEGFRLGLEEMRRYYTVHLLHPLGGSDVHSRTTSQLQIVRALGKIDPIYPSALSEGILLLRLGDAPLAEAAFRSQLTAHPNGRWAHIAQSHLQLAATRARAMSR